LPAIYRPDENVAVGRAMGLLHGVLDPHFADWPHLFFNLSALWLAPAQLLGVVHDQPSAHFWVRLLSALLGTITVLVLIDFGRRAFGRSAGLIVVARVNDPWLTVAGAAAAHLEQRGRAHQIAELGVAIVAGVEVRALFGDAVAKGCERGPPVVVGGHLHGVTQMVHQCSVSLKLRGRGAWGRLSTAPAGVVALSA